MNITYTKQGDYYCPNIVLAHNTHYQIGKYGCMRRAYLKEYYPITYNDLLLSEKLFSHLAEVDETCHQRLDSMIPAMAKREGVNAALKRTDAMEWTRRMNNIKACAEEIILAELVFAE